LIILITFDEEANYEAAYYAVSPVSCYFNPLKSNMFLSTLFSDNPILCSYINLKNQRSQPRETTGKIMGEILDSQGGDFEEDWRLGFASCSLVEVNLSFRP
jgi:hypothetical protein